MKKLKLTLALILLVNFIANSQNITLALENPNITNDGVNDYYEIDVYLSSDVDYIQGSGQFLYNYNPAAFGINVSNNLNVDYERPSNSLLGSQTIGIDNYKDFIQNDNTDTRTSITWQQFWSGGTIGINVTSTPTLLLHMKIKMIDINADPQICFDTTYHPAFDDQFFTACGPYAPGIAAADCFGEPGSQLFDFTPDCSGAIGTCGGGTTTWNGAWDNGAPNNTMNAIIDAPIYDTAANGGSIDACSLQVTLGSLLVISPNDYLKVEEDIIVDGTLYVAHEGSLVQVNDLAIVTNNNAIIVTKTTPVATGNSFSILGSPMSASTRDGVFTANNVLMNHDTNLFNLDPAVTAVNIGAEHFADAEGDNWIFITGAAAINPIEGYLVGPTTASVSSGSYDLTYNEGTLNNGVYTFNTLYKNIGTASENKSNSPNILSNPYASAIDADMLISNNAVIDELYFWEHLTAPDANYPGYRSENWDMGDISIRNSGGGVAAPNGGAVPTQFIPSGQGFAIKANALGTVTFNNALRVTGNNTGYRTTEVERMYLNISNDTYALKSSALVAFTSGATDGYEAMYDTKRLATPISIYSVLEERELAIQGRSVFTTDQIIPLGFRTMVDEMQTYTINLGEREGANINAATVYLQDNVLNTVTNLSEENYTFTSNESNQKERFVIVFTEEQLGNSEVSLEVISLYPNPTDNILNIVSPLSSITKVEVYDLQGRLISSIKIDNKLNYQLDMSSLNIAVYFVKIETNNGTLNTKIIKK